MTPYYQDSHVTIYHGDALEILASGCVGPVDVVVADPNYGETSLVWDERLEGWPSCVAKAVLPTTSLWCFGSLRMFISTAKDFELWHLSQEIVWEKHNGSSFHADRFRRVHELAALFYRDCAAWGNVYHSPLYTADATKRTARRKGRPAHTGNIGSKKYVSEDGGPRLMRSVMKVRSCHGKALHPTQKPESLVARLVEYSCPPSGVVLEPFMGSGTACRVAKDTGRKAIGIDILEECCETAAQRMAQEALALEVPVRPHPTAPAQFRRLYRKAVRLGFVKER